MKTQHKILVDSGELLQPAGGSADTDAGQPTRSATARDALTAPARLLARQAAEAMRATTAATQAASETEHAT